MQRITSRLDVHLSPGDQASRSPVLAELLEARLCLSTVTFPTTPDEYLVGQGNLSYPALADFNGDGHLDIAEANDSAPNPTGGTVSVLLNKGDGTYNAATTLQAGGRPFEAIAGDFNGDTHQDLVVSNAQDGTLDFYAGNGSGGFAAGVLSTYGNPATVGEGVLASIAAADLNGDGKLDLIVSDEHDNKLTTMLGDGAGSFAVSQQISGIFTSIVTGDFNADGHADVVSVGSNGNVIDLYLNTGTGGQLATVTPLNTGAAGGSQGGGLVTGDFNGDAKPDLALLTKSVTSDTAPFTVFLNQGGGTFSAAITTNLQFAADLAVGDFDGDGKLDIVTTNEVNLVVYPGNGDGTVQTTAAFNLQNFNMSGGPSVGDVNGDAKPDIIAFGSIAASTLPGPVMSVFINGQTGDGGGGGGGGGGAATLTPTIASSTVPTALVGGAKLKGALKVSLDNTGGADATGFTVKVYASTDATLDTTTDTLVTTAAKTPTVKAGKTANLTIPVTQLPAGLPDGSYFLIVQTVDSANNAASAATAAQTIVAAPFVALSESVASTLPASLVSGTSAKGTVTLSITNNGNVASSGVTAIDITASTTAGTPGTSIATLSKSINILPGKTAKVVVPVKSTPALADDSYFLVAQVTDPFAAAVSIASSSTATTIAAPFVELTATLSPVVNIKSGSTLTVTNNGNIDDKGTFTATIGFSFVPGPSPIGQTASAAKVMTIKAGKSVKIKSNGFAKILTGLAPGVPYLLSVTVSDDTGHTASALSPNSFTL